MLGYRNLNPRLTPFEEAVQGHTEGLWVAESSLAAALQKRGCRTLAVPGPDYLAIYTHASAGILELPLLDFGLHSREMHGRWTIEAVTEATLWLNVWAISAFRIEDINTSGLSVEILT